MASARPRGEGPPTSRRRGGGRGRTQRKAASHLLRRPSAGCPQGRRCGGGRQWKRSPARRARPDTLTARRRGGVRRDDVEVGDEVYREVGEGMTSRKKEERTKTNENWRSCGDVGGGGRGGGGGGGGGQRVVKRWSGAPGSLSPRPTCPPSPPSPPRRPA